MRKWIAIPLLLVIVGCTPIERTAYDTIVAAKAFLDKTKSQHPECSINNQAEVCRDLNRAVAAKDLIIDALEVYCSGPQFNTGGACNPPAKGTAAYTQATDKLTAAITSYNTIAGDLKGALLK